MESTEIKVKCNECISLNKWSKDGSLYKCINYEVLLNTHQILKMRECRHFIESMEKLIDI